MCVFQFLSLIFVFFTRAASSEIYTLSLHDALPISGRHAQGVSRADGSLYTGPLERPAGCEQADAERGAWIEEDRKSTRLNSSHDQISYAVFCLKKKKQHSIPLSLKYRVWIIFRSLI